MQTEQHPLLVANWKMNPQTAESAKQLAAAIKKQAKRVSEGIVIAAPFPFLTAVGAALRGSGVALGAQDVSTEKLGAFTGDVSVGMLRDLGVSHVIIGHSERRARGETDDAVSKKLQLVLRADVTAVLCIGERERDHQGKYFSVIETQLRSALDDVTHARLPYLTIAYEPVWAISTSTPDARAATPEDAHEMILFIRKILTDLYGRASAKKVRILYGGSVDQKNCAALVAGSGADGYLVGGASLRPDDFSTIIKTVYA